MTEQDVRRGDPSADSRWLAVEGPVAVVVQVLRVVLLAVAVVSSLAAVLVQPVSSSVDDLAEDLDRGRVTWLAVGERVVGSPGLLDGSITSGDTDVFWRDGLVGVRSVPVGSLVGRYPGSGSVDDGDGDGDEVYPQALVEGLRAEAAAQDVILDEYLEDRLLGVSRWWGWVSLLLLLELLLGPQPRRCTRWAWFWLLGLPLGLGVLWMLALESPWARRTTRALPELLPHRMQAAQPGGDPRFTGGWAFLLALVASAALMAVLDLLA